MSAVIITIEQEPAGSPSATYDFKEVLASLATARQGIAHPTPKQKEDAAERAFLEIEQLANMYAAK